MTRIGILACLAATCACHGKPPVLAGGPATRIELAHPMRPSQLLVAVYLAPGEQIEWRAPGCEKEEVTSGHWIEALKKQGWLVQTGSWSIDLEGNTLSFWGLRFRRADGLYGDLYAEVTINARQEVCANYVIRLQRGRDGSPVSWQTRFTIRMEGDPSFYFHEDPSFPVDANGPAEGK